MKRLDVDVAIVGAGPGGLAAAEEVLKTPPAPSTTRIALIDDAPEPGGQIWRPQGSQTAADSRRYLETLHQHRDRIRCLTGTQVVDCLPRGDAPPGLLAVGPGGPIQIRANSLILATGAMERFLPFPGWTLPGVVGAGGLQALIKGGFDVSGRRVVIAGSGPLLLAVADLARRKGANVVAVAEQASRRALLPFARAVASRPGKLQQGAGFLLRLAGVSKLYGAWPVRAEGDATVERVERVVLRTGRGSETTLECDLLACGFGLVPRVALARLIGCEVESGDAGALRVPVDGRQQTSLPGVYALGEATGVGGVDKAIAEARVAARAALGAQPLPAQVAARDRERRFSAALAVSFALRDELRASPADDTLVCRCEDVPWHALGGAVSARDAKLTSRCGMGPCQARVCGPALAFLKGWTPEAPRPPLFPIDLETLTDLYRSDVDGDP